MLVEIIPNPTKNEEIRDKIVPLRLLNSSGSTIKNIPTKPKIDKNIVFNVKVSFKTNAENIATKNTFVNEMVVAWARGMYIKELNPQYIANTPKNALKKISGKLLTTKYSL